MNLGKFTPFWAHFGTSTFFFYAHFLKMFHAICYLSNLYEKCVYKSSYPVDNLLNSIFGH